MSEQMFRLHSTPRDFASAWAPELSEFSKFSQDRTNKGVFDTHLAFANLSQRFVGTLLNSSSANSEGSSERSRRPAGPSTTLHVRALIDDYREHGSPSAEAKKQGAVDPIDELLERTYSRLQQIAHARIQSGGSLKRREEALDLLHAAWVSRIRKALQPGRPEIKNTAHFFALSAELIRQTLIDMERRSKTARGEANAIVGKTNDEGRSQVDDATDGFASLNLYGQVDVTDAIQQLPEDEREVLTLSIINGLSRRETADVLKLTESEVRTKLDRAKESLAKFLQAYNN